MRVIYGCRNHPNALLLTVKNLRMARRLAHQFRRWGWLCKNCKPEAA